jgi:hypothetical protein
VSYNIIVHQELVSSRLVGLPPYAYLGVCVSQLDGNVPLQLVLEPDGLYSRDSLDDGRLSVGYVTDSTDVDL